MPIVQHGAVRLMDDGTRDEKGRPVLRSCTDSEWLDHALPEELERRAEGLAQAEVELRTRAAVAGLSAPAKNALTATANATAAKLAAIQAKVAERNA